MGTISFFIVFVTSTCCCDVNTLTNFRINIYFWLVGQGDNTEQLGDLGVAGVCLEGHIGLGFTECSLGGGIKLLNGPSRSRKSGCHWKWPGGGQGGQWVLSSYLEGAGYVFSGFHVTTL